MTDPGEVFRSLVSPAGQADPYPLYAQLHAAGEVTQPMPGVTVAVGYDVISQILRDPVLRTTDRVFLDREFPQWREHPSIEDFTISILNSNPPDHPRMRGLMTRAFTARRVAGMAPAIEHITDGLLGRIAEASADGERLDFMAEFAFPLPVTVICELLGIPEADRARFRPLAHSLTATFEMGADGAAVAEADAAALTLRDYFTGLAAERQARPRDDLISGLAAAAESQQRPLTGQELLANLMLLLVAGFETTTSLLGNGLRILLDSPLLLAGLRDGSVPPAAFTEEVLRFDSPVQLTSRRPTAPVEVGGVSVAPGSEVVTLLGAGNRDPRRYRDPGQFRPQRYTPARPGAAPPAPAPLSFGGGPHFCLGAALARLEGSIAFPRLVRRFPRLAAAGRPTRRQGLVLRGYETFPVSAGPAPGQ